MASAVASPSLLYVPNSSNSYSPAPKSGILLNPYPQSRSPRMNQAQSLPLGSEGSAFGHSAPNTPYMQVNGANVPLPRAESRSSSTSGGDGPPSTTGGGHSRANSMRIRFAPLPDIRKMEEADYQDGPLAGTHLAVAATDDTQIPSPTSPGSQYSHMSANSNASASTTGATTSASFFSNPADDIIETTSDHGVMASLSSATKQKSKNWTKRIFKPLLKSGGVNPPSSHHGNDHQSDDGLWRTNSRDSYTSATSNEGGHALSRRVTTESSSRPSSAGNGASGAPLTRVQSAGMGPGRRKNTKMLNGRVYGSKSTAAAFQNISDGEPVFVEWGHGGAGSVDNNAGSSKYASVQSGGRVSIGAVEGEEMGGEDYDDGSGVAWIKRRKQQREKERLEKEAKALQDAENAGRSAPAAVTTTTKSMDDAGASASNAGPVNESHNLTAPIPDDEAKAREEGLPTRALPERSSSQLIETVSPHQSTGAPQAGSTVLSPSASGTHTPAAVATGEELHIVKAIKIPAPPHAHAAHSHHSHEGLNEGTIGAGARVSPGLGPPSGEPAGIGAPSSKSSTDSDSSEEDDDDDEREEEESETDEDDNAENEQRKTSVCAGVEKVSRHKELEQQ